MKRNVAFLVSMLAVAGCSTPPTYVVEVATSSPVVLPQREFRIVATITDRSASPASELAVSGSASASGDADAIGDLMETTPGEYVSATLAIAREGQILFTVTAEGPDGSAVGDLELFVTCGANGAIGDVCCSAENCGSDLFCVAGQCAATLGGEDAACFESSECVSNACINEICVPSVPVLGGGTHDTENVELVVIGTASNGLSQPRDVAVNPYSSNQVWVIDTASERVTVFTNAGTESQTSRTYGDATSHHFLAVPAGLAFGEEGELATIHETDHLTQGPDGTPGDFMGPTLHSADLSVFMAGHASHLDMLHNSPNGMGIAWDRERIFWVFDGYHGSLTRYDFARDHGLGGEDHSDGIIRRYVDGQVERVAGVPSGLEMDHDTGFLYVADTGNNRIARMDTATGTLGAAIAPNYDDIDQRRMDGAMLETVIDGEAVGLTRPSGLALTTDYIFVSDNESSRIYAFDRLTFTLIDWLETGLPEGSVMGIDIDSQGALYFVDAVRNELVKITAPL